MVRSLGYSVLQIWLLRRAILTERAKPALLSGRGSILDSSGRASENMASPLSLWVVMNLLIFGSLPT